MRKALFLALQVSLCTVGYLCASNGIANAQVTSDGTVNTQVTQDGNVAEITGGETRGSNLFHSFSDFSIPTGNEAFFNNADSISNIFSRVTGGNISNIDGAIRANGSASLFLINPAGIIFGENARLDIGGSFYGSTASSVLFEDGEFSAVDNLQQPVLTINAPIGLGFRDEPGDIINRSRVVNSSEERIGLEVASGQTLALIGGDLNFETGQATASGGNIYLGGLSQAGTVSLSLDGSFSFPANITLSNITLTNGADVNVTGSGGGKVTVDAQNLTLEAGELGASLIRSGIRPESTNPEAQAGDVVVNVAENIRINNGGISNQVAPEGIGNAGSIVINTSSLELLNGGGISASTFGEGNAGAVEVTATGDITADGENSAGFQSGITSLVDTNATGNSGGVKITTTNLNLTAGGRVGADTFGEGDAGAVEVTATGDITADGESDSEGFSSGITSQVSSSAIGNSGGVKITTTNLNLTAGGQVDASILGEGDAGAVEVTATGDITADGENSAGFPSGISSLVNSSATGNSGGVKITTTNLNLTTGGRVDASTFGEGDAGAVEVTATGDITANGENSAGFQSGITSAVDTNATGNSGGVKITATNLNLTTGGRVAASTFGQGDAGAVEVTATGDITANGENSAGFQSGITSQVDTNATGNSGGVKITTTNLNLTTGGRVDASTLGQGNAGAVEVTASGDITADGEDLDGFQSGITSLVNSSATGNSGGVKITTTNLNLTTGGRVDASTLGQGDAGAAEVTATGDITADGESDTDGFPSGITSLVDTNATGNSGGVKITTTNLNLTAGGRVGADTFGQGDANNVDITATESISIDGSIERFRSGISANAQNQNGNGGNIFISTGNLTIANGGTIEATNFDNIRNNNPGTGRPGTITINANSLALNNARIDAATQFTEEASGNINLNIAKNITLRNNSFISAQAFGDASGGNLTIDAEFIIAYPDFGTGNDLVATADRGEGGNIILDVLQVFGLERGDAINDNSQFLSNNSNDIDASSNASGLSGNVTIDTSEINPIQGTTELPSNVVEPGQTIGQACQADREQIAQRGLTIEGKGGITPDPKEPLDSLDVYVGGESTSAKVAPAPIKTIQGKVQPARGIEVTESGEIILTAYKTNNSGERLPEIKQNCDRT